MTREFFMSGLKAVAARTAAFARHAGRALSAFLLLAPGEAVHWAARLDRRTLAWSAVGLGAVLLLSFNLIASTLFRNARADLTADRLFTMSDSTRRVLRSLDEPITMRVFYSHKLGEAAPLYRTYFERVRTLLERYRDLARGRIDLAFVNPEAFSDAEDRAVSAGLRGIRLNNEGEMGYFGLLATNSTDNTESIGFFTTDRERFLEYDLTKLVYTLATPKKRVVGLMSGIPIDGGMGQMGRPAPPWLVMDQIREVFEVKSVAQDAKEIPSGVETLMLVQPGGLTAEAAYAVDQFALRGGRVLAFVDPLAEIGSLGPMGGSGGADNKELKKLLEAWGVAFDAAKVAGDIGHARRVQFGGGGRAMVTEYVAWLGLDRRNLEGGDVLSGGIERLNLATPGFIAKREGATTAFRPILRTSTTAQAIDTAKFGMRPDPVALLRSFKPEGKALVLAARVTGDARTAFPDGAPQPDKTAEDAAGKDQPKPEEKVAQDKPTEGTHAAAGRINAIVVADSDMLYDQFWVDVREMFGQQVQIPQAHNAAFVLNALENLAGGEALTELRGRGVNDRPFELVNEIRREAERRFREKEQTLVAKLKELEDKLAKIETRGDGGAVILSEPDKQAIETFRAEMIAVRRELRDVKLALRQDIDWLDGVLKFINIAGVPLLIGISGIALTTLRRRREKPA